MEYRVEKEDRVQSVEDTLFYTNKDFSHGSLPPYRVQIPLGC